MKKNNIMIIFLVLILNSCITGKNISINNIGNIDLLENKIGNTGYFISLPENYYIETFMGPDFDVYYINTKNTELEEITNGGIYLGNHPSLFGDDKEINLIFIENIYCKIFNKDRKWKVYNNENNYIAEIIIRNNGGKGGDNYMHIWTNGKTKDELYKIVYLFSTLRK
jgi:hypothetical protein